MTWPPESDESWSDRRNLGANASGDLGADTVDLGAYLVGELGAGPGAEPGASPGAEPGASPGAEPGPSPGAEPGASPGAEPGDPTHDLALSNGRSAAEYPAQAGGLDSELPGDYREPVFAPRRAGRWLAACTLLAVGVVGLAVAGVGIARQLLPRQFTAAEQRQIMAWEVERRWRALPAGTIFPDSVPYQLPAAAVYASGGLQLQAHRLGIAAQASCSADVSAAAARILTAHGCSAVLRATYVDSSGSIVATIAVAVLPGSTAARTVLVDLTAGSRTAPMLLRTLRVARTAAASFGDAQRQLSTAGRAGPYVILSTVGFADGRRWVPVAADRYLDQEMTSLAQGLTRAASAVLGSQPPPPSCPGTPGC